METPSYIKALLKPNGKKPAGRKVWSIDLETVWLPFFRASNTMGDTAIPHEAMGAPLRLAYNADGSVKFTQTGRPAFKVASDLANSVRNVRDQFTAGLLAYANGVAMENPEGYKAEVQAEIEAGKAIVEADRQAQAKAEADREAQAVAQAEAIVKAEVQKPKAERKRKPKARSKVETKAEGEADRVLVTA